jgi:hypothetical protein
VQPAVRDHLLAWGLLQHQESFSVKLQRKIVASVFAITLACFSVAGSAMDKSPAPEGAEVYIISPENGATVTSPVQVVFGLKGMGVAPAGVDSEHTGHHHLIIDAPLPDLNLPIPADDNYKHFGKGQTETTIELEPGKHTLQLLMGNFIHVPHADAVASEVIEITVK